jgi:hypothetical protein
MFSIKRTLAANVPLVVIESYDAAQTETTVLKQLNGRNETAAVVHHDMARGMVALNQVGLDWTAAIAMGEDVSAMKVYDLLVLMGDDAARQARTDEPQAVQAIFHNPQLYWTGERGATIVQAIWNLRDLYKRADSALYLIVPVGTTLPIELKTDVVVLRDTLPERAAMKQLVMDVTGGLKKKPDDADIERAADTLSGLPDFVAEQSLAMSVTLNKGIDLPLLWMRKRQEIEATQGLKMYDSTIKFCDVGGYDNAKSFLGRIRNSLSPVKLIVFEDEIDKAYAGLAGDTSGVTQDQLGAQLKYMQSREARGIIFFGVRGSGKTMLASALGNELGIPTIEFDRGAMKGKLVGESEERMRRALDVVDAVSGGGNVLFVATCNRMAVLPPELLRRYNYSTYFFDLPDSSARDIIWKLYLAKWPELNDMALPKDTGWSGSDIKNCAFIAHDLRLTLEEATKYIVPIGVSSRSSIDEMRAEAHNRYIDAAREGIYRFAELETVVKPLATQTGRRRLNIQADIQEDEDE